MRLVKDAGQHLEWEGADLEIQSALSIRDLVAEITFMRRHDELFLQRAVSNRAPSGQWQFVRGKTVLDSVDCPICGI